jgi:HK97 family phage major capsid protein
LISFGNASFAGSTSVVTVALTSAAISGALNRLTGEAGAAAAAVVVVVVVVESGAPFGEFLQAVHRAATNQGIDPRLSAAALGANSVNGADGGFLVGTTLVDDLARRMTAGEVRSRVQRVPLDPGTDSLSVNVIDETSRATGSRSGAVQGYWVEQGQAPTASRPKFAQINMRLHGLSALGYATNSLLRNAAALEAIMTDAFSDELAFLVEDAIINGTGAGSPLGVLNAPALVSVSKETGQDAATIMKENIDKMWARLYARARANAVWFINQDVEPQLDNLQMVIGLGGVPVYLPPGGLSDTPYARLKGRPVIPVEYCATLGTVGDIILADLSEYRIIDAAMQSASSMHVAFTTNEMAFRVTYECDGQPRWKSALTPYKGSNTLSPFVALATRA